jgi:hypothetical protein
LPLQPNFGSREYYEGIGRTLEAGKFHLAFFDDRLATPDKYADDFLGRRRLRRSLSSHNSAKVPHGQ